MKILFSILSLSLALNLGSHVSVFCNEAVCAMGATVVCKCETSKTDNCCQSKSPKPKCSETIIDGKFSPVFSIKKIDIVTEFTVDIRQFKLSGLTHTTFRNTAFYLRLKPDKMLNLPLLV